MNATSPRFDGNDGNREGARDDEPQGDGGAGDRDLYSDLENLARRASRATRSAEQQCADSVRARPYTAVAVAAGLGVVLGGGLPRGLLTLMLGTGLRLAASHFGDRILAYAGEIATADGSETGDAR